MRRKLPTSYKAGAPYEVWTWDITWILGPFAGMFLYLYLIVDIFSRKVIGREVHEHERAESAAMLIRQAVIAENCTMRPLVLHAESESDSPLLSQNSRLHMGCRVDTIPLYILMLRIRS